MDNEPDLMITTEATLHNLDTALNSKDATGIRNAFTKIQEILRKAAAENNVRTIEKIVRFVKVNNVALTPYIKEESIKESLPHLSSVTSDKQIGQGIEVTVFTAHENPRLVIKRPHSENPVAWADKEVTIPEYQVRIFNALKPIASIQEFLPADMYISTDETNAQVLVTENLNPSGKGDVFSLGDFAKSNLENSLKKEKLLDRIRKIPIDDRRLEELLEEALQKLGNQVLDEVANRGKLLLTPDAFYVAFDEKGIPKLALQDFGLVTDISTWDSEKKDSFLRSNFMNIMFSLAALKQLVIDANQQG